MSWNDSLYLYSRERGEQYFNQEDGLWNGVLLPEYKGAALGAVTAWRQ